MHPDPQTARTGRPSGDAAQDADAQQSEEGLLDHRAGTRGVATERALVSACLNQDFGSQYNSSALGVAP
jgi:hypothetical protein